MDNRKKAFHSSRRKKFMDQIGEGSIALILSDSLKVRSYDENYKFEQNKNFYYLTGFCEPNSALLLAPAGIKVYDKSSKKDKIVKEILFVQEKNQYYEAWDGKRLGKDNVKDELGIAHSLNNHEMGDFVGYQLRSKIQNFYMNIVDAYEATGEIKDFLAPIMEALRVNAATMQLIDSSYILGKMRSVKTEYEIREMQNAVNITKDSLLETMMNIRPGLYEYQVQSVLEFNYKFRGSDEPAFPTIVASGANACTLHYNTNRERIEEGKLLLIDTGAQSHYYCSDITRTYPVSGKFDPAQRVIYDIVLKVNKLCIKKIMPGLKMSDLKKFAEDQLAAELIKLKLIKKPFEVKKYYIHGIGHHLGLDTHDAVPYGKGKKHDNDSLKAGNVVTIEPGLYFPQNAREIPKKFRGVGVRIEDDVLVTRNGHDNLSKSIIKEADEIEEAMSHAI